MIYSLTAIGLAPGDSSTVHVHTNNTQNNKIKHNIWNGTHITIIIHKHNNIGITPLKFPTAPFHLTSLHFTSHHYT